MNFSRVENPGFRQFGECNLVGRLGSVGSMFCLGSRVTLDFVLLPWKEVSNVRVSVKWMQGKA